MASLLDVLDPGEADSALKGMRGADAIETVPGLVTSVSRLLDEMCGPIVARVVTVKRRDACGVIYLPGKPLAGAAAPVITEAWSSETPVTVLSTDYLLEADEVGASLTRWSGYWGPRLSVTYTAGRYATTAAVEPHFKKAATMLLQHLWRRTDGGGSDTYGPPTGFVAATVPSFAVPNAVRGVLYGELLPPNMA